MRASAFVCVFVAIAGGSCKNSDRIAPYDWELPAGFTVPPVPATNPMSAAKVELGRHLFYERDLSYNRTQSCASCHRQSLGFADGKARPRGSTGELLPRNAPGLVNVAYFRSLTWVNPLLTSLERQIVVPMFSDSPVELGLAGKEAEVLARLSADPVYRALFARAFPGDADPVSVAGVVRALACFLRSMIAANSPYDRYLRGDREALSPAARRGLALFESDKLGCASCHTGPNLSLAAPIDQAAAVETFFNMGLHESYPPGSTGRHELTGVTADRGRMRIPSLRNVAVTAPYFHDGSVATLEEVVAIYEAGGRGAGAANPHKDPRVAGFRLAAGERADLLAFLEALTDRGFLSDPRFADPGRP